MEKIVKGEKEINDESSMIDITTRFPGARRALFAKYHIGGCSSCAYQDDETLSKVCERNEISKDDVIEHILNSHKEDQKMMIEPLEVKKLLNEHTSNENAMEIRFVDTRTREEHEAVSIPGSYFMTQELQQEIFASWDRSADLLIVLYDHQGKSALDTCAWFIGHEMKNTVALVGGIDLWSQDVDSKISRYKLEM